MDFGKRKLFFNYRPIASAVLFLMLGIIFVVGMIVNSAVYLLFSLLSVTCLILTLLFKSVFAKEKLFIKLTIIIVSFLVGFTFTSIKFYSLNNI